MVLFHDCFKNAFIPEKRGMRLVEVTLLTIQHNERLRTLCIAFMLQSDQICCGEQLTRRDCHTLLDAHHGTQSDQTSSKRLRSI